MGGNTLTAVEDYSYSGATGAVTVPNVTGEVVITAAGIKLPTPITGSVAIRGAAKYGETLSADVSGVIPDGADHTCAWSRDDGAQLGGGSAVTLKKEDIGRVITLTVTGTGAYSGTLTASTAAVSKADGPAAPDAGSFTVTHETALRACDGSIEGVTAEMDWSDDNGATWHRGNGAALQNLAPGDYQVRSAESETHLAGGSVTLTVNAYSLIPEAAPEGEFDAETMTLSNVEAGMKYSVDGGESWIEITGTSAALDEAGLSVTHGIQVRRPGNGSTTGDSAVQAIVLTRAKAPVVAGRDQTEEAAGAITGTTTAMEYRRQDETAWSVCPAGETQVAPGDYEVRVKGAGTQLASEAVSVTVKAWAPPAGTPVTGVRLDRDRVSLYVDETVALTVSVEPADADNRNVTWESSDESVATVNRDGVVTPVSAGKAVITVSTEDGGFTATCICSIAARPVPPPYVPPVDRPDKTEDKGETVTNPDGSVTTTVTDKDTGAVTQTTEYEDGKTVKVETAAGGGKTIIVSNGNGEKAAVVVLPPEIPVPERPFTDVPAGHWSAEAVNTVVGLGLFTGTGPDQFDGDAPMTRGMLTTVLHRLSGEVPGGENLFADVDEGAWYADSIVWAAANGIVTGVGKDRFAPEAEIVRESLAAMLYRYAALLGLDTAARSETLHAFADGAEVSAWAAEAMAWAVQSGILQGNGSMLNPGGSTDRAQAAAMISRFVELLK